MSRLLGAGCVLLVLTCAAAKGSEPLDLVPLMAEPAGSGEPGKVQPQAKPDPSPLFYYNGDAKRFLFDTGQAVVKVKPIAGLAPFAGRPEVIETVESTSLGALAETLESQNLVVVQTRGPQSLSLLSSERPAEAEYVLPILQDSVTPRGPIHAGRAADRPIIVMTPQVSVRFRDAFFSKIQDPQAKRAKAEAYLAPFGLKVANPPDKPLRISNAFTATLREGDVTYSRLIVAANRLFEKGRATGDVLYAKPNFLRAKTLCQPPIQDPRFGNQWHLHNTGQGDPGAEGVVDADVDAPEAWQVTEGSPTTRIAIIDDSVQKNHPDLKANYQAGRHYDGATASFDDDPSPRSPGQEHGTACAGVAVAAANDIGVRGVAPRCGLIGVHFWDANDDLQTADAFYFAADPDGDSTTDDGASVISCSWSLVTDEIPIEISSAVDDVAAHGRGGKGTVILFAAGNESWEIDKLQKLGAREAVICVGASNFRDARSWYSNFGPELDVMAPSNDDAFDLGIDTTDNTDDQPHFPNADRSGYAVGDYTGTGQDGFGGTSSATPLAAGICGLILSVNPNLTATQVRAILEHACDRIFGDGEDPETAYDPTTSHSDFYGYGRVNASRAVQVARAARSQPELVWPDHVQQLAATRLDEGHARLSWQNPPNNVAGVLVVRSATPIQWKPYDDEIYLAGDAVGGGAIRVVNVARRVRLDVPINATEPTYFAVFAYSQDHRYSWGQVTRVDPPAPAPPEPASGSNS